MLRRVLLAGSLLVTVLSFDASSALAHTSDGTHVKYDGVLQDAYYDALARCETGGNWQHSTRSYTGGLGIYRGTWKRWSNSSSAKGKTPRQQVKVADAIAWLGHTNPDGTYVWPVSAYGWGCVKGQKHLQQYICHSKHKAVIKRRQGC